jgi:hypothetical protein
VYGLPFHLPRAATNTCSPGATAIASFSTAMTASFRYTGRTLFALVFVSMSWRASRSTALFWTFTTSSCRIPVRSAVTTIRRTDAGISAKSFASSSADRWRTGPGGSFRCSTSHTAAAVFASTQSQDTARP